MHGYEAEFSIDPRYCDAGSDGAQRRGSTLQVVKDLLIGADPVKPVHIQIDSGHCCPTATRGSTGVSSRAQAYCTPWTVASWSADRRARALARCARLGSGDHGFKRV